MKKILFLALVAVMFGCKSSDGEPTKAFKLDPLATFSIKPAVGAWKVNGQLAKASDSIHLSALEIVKQATVIHFYFVSPLTPGLTIGERGFDKLQRDTVSENPSLKMWATDIINSDGIYDPTFIESKDLILLNFKSAPSGQYSDIIRDTIGYIPNSVLRAAEIAIKAAYTEKDTAKCYKVFNEAFTFLPITGAEYKALKARNFQ
jgi:hypothetical protein